MKCPWRKIDLGWTCGDIGTLCKQALEIAITLDTKVSFDFNGVKVSLSPKTNAADITEKALMAVGTDTKSVYGEGF